MKVALVHDYLTEFGGAERVLQAIHELYPDAPVYTSLFDKEKFKAQSSRPEDDRPLAEKVKSTTQNSKLGGDKPRNYWDVRPSRISTLPLASRLTKSFTFFMPLVFENFDLREYDVIVSDGTIWSKSVLTTPEQLHIFYCHTPPRWLWGLPAETNRRRLWYLQPLLKPLDNWLRVWDFETAQRPDFIVANSKTVARRIKKFWRREAEVIYPPVDVAAPSYGASSGAASDAATTKSNYFLIVSRLSAYKNIDLAIKAGNQLKLPLKIVGTGREERRLRKLAGPTIEFLGFVSEEELRQLYQNCRALIHTASDEDFGIAPVEAMAHGKPVIALRSGGVTETVIEGKTGIFFDTPTVQSLLDALQRFNVLKHKSKDSVLQSQKFSKERFKKEFRGFVEEKWRNKLKVRNSK